MPQSRVSRAPRSDAPLLLAFVFRQRAETHASNPTTSARRRAPRWVTHHWSPIGIAPVWGSRTKRNHIQDVLRPPVSWRPLSYPGQARDVAFFWAAGPTPRGRSELFRQAAPL